ncbi:putative phenylalanine--tRNA ligase beta subunit [Astathelohania contejeani]|uniref:phenylalanine--tRNA ligase n=1 Tax=Astathelohania contejeani TaxID=164912 RepID=A0ABQ7HXC2_9MICR|nr:putative phenylalanine--tRNA ligase beta subunit [Thelohania contejeani]
MPTLSVKKNELLNLLKKEYTDDELEKIVFDYGLELDDITEESGETIYKFDIPANRYDLLCIYGLADALRCYLNNYVFKDIKLDLCANVVSKDAVPSRPVLACAIIRGFDSSMITHFIDYQEKLHHTIGRNRALLAIGTHDADKIKFPVHYSEMEPRNINFIPLNGVKKINGTELFDYFQNDIKIRRYLKLLGSRENLYPVVSDQVGILSVPPIINSDRSKITQETKNIFIEVTGTDLHRVNTALKLILYNFRTPNMYSINIQGGLNTPIFHNRKFHLTVDEVNKELGLNLTGDQISNNLVRMMHSVKLNENDLDIQTPDIRADVINKCDLIEDIAISFGYNNFIRSQPNIYTCGREDDLNCFSDKVRTGCAMAGYSEIVSLTLVSKNENIGESIEITNPKSIECEALRASLIPGLLKSLNANQQYPMPIKIFEVSDVVILKNMVGVNQRNLAACYAGKNSGLEEVQGVLSYILYNSGITDFTYEEKDDKWFFSGRGAVLKIDGVVAGKLGVIDPIWCNHFKIPFSCSIFEVNLEILFSYFKKNIR